MLCDPFKSNLNNQINLGLVKIPIKCFSRYKHEHIKQNKIISGNYMKLKTCINNGNDCQNNNQILENNNLINDINIIK